MPGAWYIILVARPAFQISTATIHMGPKVKFSPGNSVSFIQAFLSSSNLCSARKEISLEDSSEVWISVRQRIVKLSQFKLMKSETERKWNCLLSQWLCLICHYTALISPAGIGISQFPPIKRAQLGLRHFSQSQSAACESEVHCFSSKRRFSCISNTVFQACTLQKLRCFARAAG